MVLTFIVNDGSDEERYVEVDDVTLMFFDTFVAAISPNCTFERFEYEDDEGDIVVVRTDEDLAAMVEAVDCSNPIRIFISYPCASLADMVDQTVTPETLRRLSTISSGNSGTVYKTLNTNTDEIIATKCIPLDENLQMLQEVKRETDILLKCSSSPFIVKFITALCCDGQMWLCMEFMNGGSLDRYGKLRPEILAPVAVSVINGLYFLWENKVMHRDVKPGNILVNSSGDVKLGDFGVSKQLELSGASSYLGTHVYMAPERLRGGYYRICSDIWSLGVTLCEMAIGRFPFGGSSDGVFDVIRRVLTADFNLFYDLRTEFCHVDFCDVVLNCVILDENERWSQSDLINCCYVRQNTPIKQKAVADFVAEKNALL